MSKLQKIFTILIALAILPACGKAPVEVVPVIYEDFTEASRLHVTSPGTFVFEDNDSWDSFCDEYWGGGIPRPEVDFENNMIIGIFWGQTSGCYEWVNCVRTVFIRRGVIEVHISPMPDLGDCEMIVYPMQVIKIRSHELPVEFHGHFPGSPD
ncbi:MAG: hypothetical protein JSU85_00870 [Candidatus Zixiibacteriota bacterium]|nr:MAG: hypothetical protein JSU85_00870 [candidate division Zixibacteria bacterium]